MSTFKVFLFQIYFYFMYMIFFPACVYAYHIDAWYLGGQKKALGLLTL